MEDYGVLIWCLSGLVPYIIMSVIQSFKQEDYDFNKDFAENPNAGQAFLISIVLGPIFILLIGSIYMDSSKYQNEIKIKKKNISNDFNKIKEIINNLEDDSEVFENFRDCLLITEMELHSDWDFNDPYDREYFKERIIENLDNLFEDNQVDNIKEIIDRINNFLEEENLRKKYEK